MRTICRQNRPADASGGAAAIDFGARIIWGQINAESESL
jgi:hypothetical protein